MSEDLAELVEIGDLDELLRATDRLCDAREWAQLVDLRDRCRRAVERGKQLWPAANHVEYRLALEAPGEYAARQAPCGTRPIGPRSRDRPPPLPRRNAHITTQVDQDHGDRRIYSPPRRGQLTQRPQEARNSDS